MDVWAAFDGRPHRLRMGLRPLDLRRWTEPPPPAELGPELDRRRALFDHRRADVWAETDGSGPAAAELLARLAEHLICDHAARYQRGRGATIVVDGSRRVDLERCPPLPAAGLLTAADWCLVRPGPPPVFAAGVVCSPNRWRLADKFGSDVAAVHHPVPGYARALAVPVDRLLGGHGRARPGWRQNWSLVGQPARFQPGAGTSEPLDVPGGVWVRSERQTLVLLPATGWWAFGIETAEQPLTALSSRPDVAARLLAAVLSLGPATLAYKQIDGFRAPLLAWLDGLTSVHTAQQDQ